MHENHMEDNMHCGGVGDLPDSSEVDEIKVHESAKEFAAKTCLRP